MVRIKTQLSVQQSVYLRYGVGIIVTRVFIQAAPTVGVRRDSFQLQKKKGGA